MGDRHDTFKVHAHMGDEGGLADIGVHLVALKSAGHGEIGAAEQGDVIVHQDHLLVQNAMAIHEQDADARLLQFSGEIIGGFADAGAGPWSVFADDDHIEALSRFVLQGSVEILDGAGGTAGNVIGADPDGGFSVLDGFEDGLAEGTSGEQADKTSLPFGVKQSVSDSENAIGLRGIVVENVSNGGLGDVLHGSAGGVVLEHVAAGLHHEDPAGKTGAIAEGNFVGSNGGA